MKRFAPLALLVLPGGALLAAGWWWWRRRATSTSEGASPETATSEALEFEAVDVLASLPDVSSGGPDVVRVYHSERVQGLDARLQLALEDFEREGPMPIVVTSGKRTQDEQTALYKKGATKAASVADSAHGHAAAFDFAPVRETSNGFVRSIWLPDGKEGKPEMYETCAKFFEARGLKWGGRWSGFTDMPHIEVADWRAIPLA